MTHIVSPSKYPTKKAFREAIEAGKPVFVDDPSIIGGVSGNVLDVLRQKPHITVTNHPKRSWFASAEMKNGKVVVK